MKKKKATRRDINTKDEMNLAEYPIQLLTKDVPEETKTIEWHGEVTLKESLNATFYFNLKNPTAKALYTFLDKKAYQNEEFSMEIYNLASKLGLSTRQPRFKLKQTLKEASEILLNKGFLAYYEFKDIPETRDELIVFYFNKEYLSEEEIELREKHEEYVKLIVSDILQVVGDTKSKAFYEKVARSIPQEIIYRALSEVKAASLDGEIKTTKAKLFTYLVKKYAKELFNLKI
jgi:hypothetical protein